MTIEQIRKEQKEKRKAEDMELLQASKDYILECLTAYANRHGWVKYKNKDNSFQNLMSLIEHDAKVICLPDGEIDFKGNKKTYLWVQAISSKYFQEWVEEWVKAYFNVK